MEQNAYFKKIWKVYGLVKKYMPSNPYHNRRHTKDVFYSVNRLSRLEKICEENRFILGTAALLHDIIYVIGAKDNEERSADFAKKHLPAIGYNPYQVEEISRLILATKPPTHPKSLLDKIICDADVDNLGREDFFERGEEIKKEMGVDDERKWCEIQIKFLQNHKYYTLTAQELRAKGVRDNIIKLEQTINSA